jgi:acetyl-CoA carboxylase biotin carboxyl carrier protein
MLKIQEIREIIRLIDQSSINEFTFEQDGAAISIKKPAIPDVPEKTTVVKEKEEEATIQTVPLQAKQVSIVETVAEKPSQQVTTADEHIVEIVSPMVGTFYSKASPESATYVNKGDKVVENSIVCIVEAMKLFNEIEAETTGEIVEILVSDGELVEYGQALFKVKTK